VKEGGAGGRRGGEERDERRWERRPPLSTNTNLIFFQRGESIKRYVEN